MESEHEKVYGDSFNLYTSEDFEEFVRPLQIRLDLNKIDTRELFFGKRVLDAGCGNGRGSYLAINNGAKELFAVDISSQNIDSTERLTAKLKPHNTSITYMQSSLADLRLPENYFDFIWCNGVIMHTAKPSLVLASLLNMLKPGGSAWIYIYGSGGLYWQVIATFRRLFSSLSTDFLLARLLARDLPVGRVAEIIDDWKTPYLRAYSYEDFSTVLQELGYTVKRLMRGMEYDTSEQIFRKADPKLIGEGDIRVLVEKNTNGYLLAESLVKTLDISSIEASLLEPIDPRDEFQSNILELLSAFEESHKDNPQIGIDMAISAQLALRDIFLKQPSRETALVVVSHLV